MKIFITGASGFVGGAIVQRLKSQHTFYAMARSQTAARKVAERGATPVRCALETVTAEDLAGYDLVIHAAALVADFAPLKAYKAVNVDGTCRLLAAARNAGVPRFLHVSSEAVIFDGWDQIGADESAAYAEATPYGYARTKRDAEIFVRTAHWRGRFETVCIRPPRVWGPGDAFASAGTAARSHRGPFCFVGHGKYVRSQVHIHNLVEGISKAIDKWVPGGVFFITDGPSQTTRRFESTYAATRGRPLSERSVPAWLARGLAAVLTPMWRLFSIQSAPPISNYSARKLTTHFTVSDRRARLQLGYKPVISFEAGMAALRSDLIYGIVEERNRKTRWAASIPSRHRPHGRSTVPGPGFPANSLP